ncbi:MAG TPA: AgmX/PglI C-terminal domain-containing protein [Polyangiaceae bacterium]
MSPPPRVCELTRSLASAPVDLAVLPTADAFGQLAAGTLAVELGEHGAFAEVRTPSWTVRGFPSGASTRVSASRWIAFGGVLYASKRERFDVRGTREGKLVLSAPGIAGFVPTEAASTTLVSCADVSLVPDPDGVLEQAPPPAFLPAKKAQAMLLRRAKPVPLSADPDGPPGGTIEASDAPVHVMLLERRGARARIRMGHLAGWVDGALLVAPPAPRPSPPPSPARKEALREMAQFGMIGLLNSGEVSQFQTQAAEGDGDASGSGSSAPPPAAPPPPAPASPVTCASDVRLVVDWTSTGSIAASAGASDAARHYVVGVIPAGKPVRVIEPGAELTTVSLVTGGVAASEGAFLPRGYARLVVPTRDLATGCVPAPEAPEAPTAPPPKASADAASIAPDLADAVDRMNATPAPAPVPVTGSMFGEAIGDAFGAGGLGLSGVGESGGFAGGIGLGSLGTTGHGSGTGIGQGPGGLRPTSHPPSLRMGAVQVAGRLPPEVIQRIVRQNFGRFRLCYEQGLRTKPALTGRVTTRFVIGRTGAVVSASDAGSDLPSPTVVSCVVRGFSNLSFPQPEGGSVTVVFPVLFSPG